MKDWIKLQDGTDVMIGAREGTIETCTVIFSGDHFTTYIHPTVEECERLAFHFETMARHLRTLDDEAQNARWAAMSAPKKDDSLFETIAAISRPKP